MTYQSLESDLIRKNRQIDLMLSQMPGGMQICYYDRDFPTKWISEGLYHMLGYESKEEYASATGNNCRGFILQEDYKTMQALVDQGLAAGDEYTAEYRIRCRNGKIIWVQDLGKLAQDEDGEMVIFCFISDITARKEQEFEIERVNGEVRRQAKFLNQLYTTVPCGILQFTSEQPHQIINANRMAWEMYGYTKEEYFAGVTNFMDLVLPYDEARIYSLIDCLRLGGGTVSYTRQGCKKDGSPIWINVLMEKVLNIDEEVVIQVVFTDISEIHNLQEEREKEQLMENQSLRAAICQAYPLIINVNFTHNTYKCFLNENCVFDIRSSGKADQLIDGSIELIYEPFKDQFLKMFSMEALLALFHSGGTERYLEVQELGKDGNYHWVSIHVIRIHNPYSTDIMAVVLLKILDEQQAEKAKQEQLLRNALAAAEAASNAKTDFLSRMSHDIRTPLNAIIGMTAIGQKVVSEPGRVSDCLRKIESSSQYLLSLLGDILDMSKIEQGKMTISQTGFCIDKLLKDLETIQRPQAIQRNLTFEIIKQPDLLGQYIGDSLRLNQILMNLCSNALKFTHAGGRVTVSVKESRHSGEYIWLEFKVSDTGIGMSPEFLKKLYLPFEQETQESARNNVGSGLGLSIVSSLVQLMGGTIQAKSKQGKGTTFTVILPFEITKNTDDNRCKETKTPVKDTFHLEGERILLVEDNELNREIAGTLLEMQKIKVDYAENGQQAVELFSAGKPDYYLAILMDIRMPVMDGLSAAKAIRGLDRSDADRIPIIAMTANAFEEDRKQAAEAGMNGYLTKPIEINSLLTELQKYDNLRKMN